MRQSLLIVIFVLYFGFAIAKSKKAGKRYDYEFKEANIGTVYHIPDGESHFQGISHPPQIEESHHELEDIHRPQEKGYSAGSGLRSIAQGSANQAHSAVANQHAAGKQAAYLAKNTLAQAALQAAATAQAALTGKEVLMHELEEQVVEARHSLDAELAQLQLAKKAAKSAQQGAAQALQHVAALTATLNSAQSVAKQAEHTALKAASELASQTSMVGKAKLKIETLEEQLKSARIDFAATKEAALKAASSAKEAQHNAEEAAVHATSQLQENAGAQRQESDHSGSEVEVQFSGNDHYHKH